MAEQMRHSISKLVHFASTCILLALCISSFKVVASPNAALLFSVTGENNTALGDSSSQVVKGRLGLQSREEFDGTIVPASYLIYDEQQQYHGSYKSQESVDLELEEGKYIIHAIYSHANQEAEVEIKAGSYLERQFIFDKTSELVFTALQNDNPITAHFSVFAEDGKLLSSKLSKQSFKQRLPLGKYKLVVSYQEQEQTLDLEVNGKPSEQYWLIF